MYNNKVLLSMGFTMPDYIGHLFPQPITPHERGEAGYKLTASFYIRIEKLMREISGPCINNKELTTIWVG